MAGYRLDSRYPILGARFKAISETRQEQLTKQF